MSVLVLAEHTQGVFKKKTFEAIQYGAAIAQSMGTTTTALVLGTVDEGLLTQLGSYGAQKVLHVTDARLDNLSARAYTRALAVAAEKEGSKVIVALHDVTGKAVAPRLAARLSAGMVAGAISYPDVANGFQIKKAVFAGKGFAYVSIRSDVKVVTLMPNSFPVKKGEGAASVEKLEVSFDEKDFGVQVKEVNKVTGSVPLAEAELVVSGGRGLKGPENWHILEDLASAFGAALAFTSGSR